MIGAKVMEFYSVTHVVVQEIDSSGVTKNVLLTRILNNPLGVVVRCGWSFLKGQFANRKV